MESLSLIRQCLPNYEYAEKVQKLLVPRRGVWCSIP